MTSAHAEQHNGTDLCYSFRKRVWLHTKGHEEFCISGTRLAVSYSAGLFPHYAYYVCVPPERVRSRRGRGSMRTGERGGVFLGEGKEEGCGKK